MWGSQSGWHISLSRSLLLKSPWAWHSLPCPWCVRWNARLGLPRPRYVRWSARLERSGLDDHALRLRFQWPPPRRAGRLPTYRRGRHRCQWVHAGQQTCITGTHWVPTLQWPNLHYKYASISIVKLIQIRLALPLYKIDLNCAKSLSSFTIQRKNNSQYDWLLI